MLKEIYFKNYKAFQEGVIKIKPITILLGANSVGKSSLIQLFLMLEQTCQSDSNYKSALRLNGGFTSLGEGLNIIRNKDADTTFSYSLKFVSDKLREYYRSDLLKTFISEFIVFAFTMDNVNKNKKGRNWIERLKTLLADPQFIDIDFKIRYYGFSNEEIEKISKTLFYEIMERASNIIDDNKERIPNTIQETLFIKSSFSDFTDIGINKTNYLMLFNVLKGICENINSNMFEIKWEIEWLYNQLIIKRFEIFNDEKSIIGIRFNNNEEIYSANNRVELYSSLPLPSNSLDQFNNIAIDLFSPRRTVFNFVKEKKKTEIESGISHYLKKIFDPILKQASSYFEPRKINYVSPLRAHPQRYYFLDKANQNNFIDTLDGDSITEVLRENSNIKDQVNNWLNKFNLNINVNQLRDIIHKLVIIQNALELDITDVGFGISQVLPVIIQGFLSEKLSITLIEQPEIHLHPQMQADLADLFVDIVLSIKKANSDKFLIIETHSEYLLKRLRRRISDETIDAEQVAIYLIDPQTKDQPAKINELNIQNRGRFEWPVDFYGGELLKDTTEFIKNQQIK